MRTLNRHTSFELSATGEDGRSLVAIRDERPVYPPVSRNRAGPDLVHCDPCSCNRTGHFREEIPRRIIEIQGKSTAVRASTVAQRGRLTEVNGSQEVSIGVVVPYPVSEFVGAAPDTLPYSQADVAGSRVDIRIVYFGSTGVPQLIRRLDHSIVCCEFDIPEADYRRTLGALS